MGALAKKGHCDSDRRLAAAAEPGHDRAPLPGASGYFVAYIEAYLAPKYMTNA